MLFNLSRKNFKKSIRDYSVYFFTLILGVAVFYIFNAIETQTAMMEVTKAKAEIIDMMNSALEAVSIFVSFILGYLIVYASRFMLKKEKRICCLPDTRNEKNTDFRNVVDRNGFYGNYFTGCGAFSGNWIFSVYVSFCIENF